MICFWPLPPAAPYEFEGRHYDRIFTSSFQEQALNLLGTDPTYENHLVFREGHLAAFEAYTNGVYQRENFAPLKAENEALEKVAKAADGLMNALTSLHSVGSSAGKLVREIKQNPTHYRNDRRETLADLLDVHRRNNELFSLVQFLSDIWVSAERAQDKRPMKFSKFALLTENLGDNATNPSDEFMAALGEAVFENRSNCTEDFEDDIRRWNQRSKARKIPKDFPLTQFIKVFRKTWRTFSGPKPATQGHHYSEIGQTSSIFVDLIDLSLQQHNAPFTRQNIVTAIRKQALTHD